jgi:hypothetical protein
MRSSLSSTFEVWNRKLHYYIGLYLLLFLWLFSFTGLLLNHQDWQFAQFWPERKETRFEKTTQPVLAASDLGKARELMRQLNVAGEIDWPTQKQTPGRLDFAVNRPGRLFRISADLVQNRVSIQQTDINSWGVINALHTFSGTRANNPESTRDWMLTTIWVVAMDVLAAGILLMVLSSYYMWYRLKSKRTWGLIAFAMGTLICGFFVAGLSRL